MEQQEKIGRELTLFVPSTGEAVRLMVRDADPEDLANAYERVVPQIRRELAEAEEIIGDELVRLSDVALEGTRRYGDPSGDAQFEVVVSSEAAGSDDWDITKVEAALAEMLAAGELVEEGAANVVEHTVTVRYRFGSRARAAAFADEARADERVVGRPAPERRLSKDGMNRLLKRAVAAEYLKDAKKPPQAPPKRKPKVRRIEKRPVQR